MSVIDKLLEFYETHAWARGEYARKRNGAQCEPNDPGAYSFCLLGACKAIGDYSTDQNDLSYELAEALHPQLKRACPYTSSFMAIHRFNDLLTSRPQMLAALRQAKERQEA